MNDPNFTVRQGEATDSLIKENASLRSKLEAVKAERESDAERWLADIARVAHLEAALREIVLKDRTGYGRTALANIARAALTGREG